MIAAHNRHERGHTASGQQADAGLTDQARDDLVSQQPTAWRERRSARTATTNPAPISQQQRLATLRRLLTDEQIPLLTRVAATLVLLYAQPLTRSCA
jgi:hypothetical protein